MDASKETSKVESASSARANGHPTSAPLLRPMAEHVVVRCEAEMVGEVLTPFEQAGLSIVGLKTTNDGRAVIAMRVEADAHAVAAPLLASVRTRCAVWASASNEEALTHMSNAFAPREIVQQPAQPRTRASSASLATTGRTRRQ